MRHLSVRSVAFAAPLFLLAAGACKDDPPPAPAPIATAATAAPTAAATATATTAAITTASAQPSVSAAPAIGAAPACKIVAQKSWAKGLNKTTGLTEVELADGRVAIGYAVGNEPQVLVVGRKGEGEVHKVPLKPGTKLATAPKKGEATRWVMRVTPVRVDSTTVQAFVDYRDEYKDKKRMRVACGPADSDDAWISFDDVPMLDRESKPTGKVREALFNPKDPGADEGYHELRDCRTFADLVKGETWVVGSELRGTGAEGGETWKASLVVDKGSDEHELHLHESELKGAPPKVMNFEIPVSRRAADGTFVLAARYGGSLVVALLNEDKTLRTMKSYPGWPTLPDITQDGDDIVIATATAKPNSKEYILKALRMSTKHPELPKELVPIITDDDDKDSETAPDFTRDSKGRRWMTYIEGERGNGHLEIVPINAAFQALGKPFEITSEDERASEARSVALPDGTIFMAYLRDKDKSTELVTLDLECEVVAK